MSKKRLLIFFCFTQIESPKRLIMLYKRLLSVFLTKKMKTRKSALLFWKAVFSTNLTFKTKKKLLFFGFVCLTNCDLATHSQSVQMKRNDDTFCFEVRKLWFLDRNGFLRKQTKYHFFLWKITKSLGGGGSFL